MTEHELAAMRREHGGTWKLTYVAEGYDDEFVVHVGLKVGRRLAVHVGKVHVARRLDISARFVHLQSCIQEGG